MSVPVKPYVALIYPVDQEATAQGVAGNPARVSSPNAIYCYFERISPGEAYLRYGVNLSDPAFIQCEVFDGSKFQPDFEVLLNDNSGRVYKVVGLPEIHDAGNDADHADIVLDFKRYHL